MSFSGSPSGPTPVSAKRTEPTWSGSQLARMLIRRMGRRLFPGVPHYFVLMAIAVFAFANPTPYLIATPGIYEAAIGGCQAFLLVGLANVPMGRFGSISAGSRHATALRLVFETTADMTLTRPKLVGP